MFSVAHPIACDACQKENFTGFRYRCQKCHSYQLCQDCFWRGKVSGTHNNDHETREYSSFVCIINHHFIRNTKISHYLTFNNIILADRSHRASRSAILCGRASDAYLKRGRIVYRDFRNSRKRHWICHT